LFFLGESFFFSICMPEAIMFKTIHASPSHLCLYSSVSTNNIDKMTQLVQTREIGYPLEKIGISI
jgi:hypothetical protein